MRKTPRLTQRCHRCRAHNLLSLNGYDYPDIQRAILAEIADAPLIQWDARCHAESAGLHNDRPRTACVILPAGRNARHVAEKPSVESLFLALTRRVK
jgi:hypothetical protein